MIGKSDTNKDVFDILHIAYTNTKDVTIPHSIKFIYSYSFYNLSVEKIFISSCVTEIKNYAFNHYHQLKLIDIPQDSELKIIDNYTFSITQIKSLYIPRLVKEICFD